MAHQNTCSLAMLIKSIADLPPAQIAQAERALGAARRRAEPVVEINAAGQQRACPRCGSTHRARWGSTRAGAQRWRCKGCSGHWTGRSGTPLVGVHRPGLFIEVARNMLDTNEVPLSCRKLGRRLGLSRDTIWRWRMMILAQLKAAPVPVLSGIVETDDTAQRESRKGSREWVRHERDPSQPKPPRRRWHEYPKFKPPQAIARRWSEPILGVVDRTGRAIFQYTKNMRQATLDAALTPQIAPDAMVLFDEAPQYEAVARARSLSFRVLVAGRRSARTPQAFHLNGVNAPHAQWKEISKAWRGPATKHLDGYARWLAARRDGDPLALFRAIIT